MKKHLLILAIAALSCGLHGVKAQNIIPITGEDGFEVWSPVATTSAYDPNNGSVTSTAQWLSLNILSSSFLGSSPISVFKDSTQKYSGSYACKIVSVKLTSTSYSYVSAFLPDTVGMVMAGTIITTPSPSFKPGTPFNRRITQLNFWYLYMPQIANGKPDTASCIVELTHRYGGVANILGGGEYRMNAASTLTYATVPITYDSATGNPDTIDVVFNASSYFKPVLHDTLIIDAASVPLGINEVHTATTSVKVYPNPASSEVNFIISGKQAHIIDVYDITGQKVNSYNVKNNSSANINTSAYNSGLYIYQVRDKAGNALKTGKFSVVK